VRGHTCDSDNSEGIESNGSESTATTTIPPEAVPQHRFSVRFVFFCSPFEKFKSLGEKRFIYFRVWCNIV